MCMYHLMYHPDCFPGIYAARSWIYAEGVRDDEARRAYCGVSSCHACVVMCHAAPGIASDWSSAALVPPPALSVPCRRHEGRAVPLSAVPLLARHAEPRLERPPSKKPRLHARLLKARGAARTVVRLSASCRRRHLDGSPGRLCAVGRPPSPLPIPASIGATSGWGMCGPARKEKEGRGAVCSLGRRREGGAARTRHSTSSIHSLIDCFEEEGAARSGRGALS